MLRTTPIIVLLLASTLFGSPKIGDHPTLNLTAIDGSTINLAAHKGKLVLIDFWAGRSDLNKTHESNLVEIHKKFKDQGLVIIGVNCDTKLPSAQQYIKELGIPWPVYWEREGWKGGLAKEWDIAHLPTDFLIDPDGALIWTGGYKRNLSEFLEEQLLLHPPRLVAPDVVAKAGASLDSVENLLKTDPASAVATFARIPDEAKKDPNFNKRWTALAKQIDEAADKLLAQIDPLVAAQDYVSAVAKLKDLQLKFTGTAREPVVRKRINEILANPTAKAAVERAEKESAAATALAAARRLRDAGEHPAAYARFKAIVMDYPATPSAQDAGTAVKIYEADEKFMKKLNEDAIASKAKAALNLADNYRTNNRPDLAKAKYESIVKDFPNTDYATQAQKALDEMK